MPPFAAPRFRPWQSEVRVFILVAPGKLRQAVTVAVEQIHGVVVAGASAQLDSVRRKAMMGEIDVLLVDGDLTGNGPPSSGKPTDSRPEAAEIEQTTNVIEVVEELVALHPNIAIFILRNQNRISHAEASLAGAVSVIDTRNVAQVLGETVRANLRTVLSELPPLFEASSVRLATTIPTASRREIIAIGASTGGPPALAAVLGSLELPPHTAVMVTQHIGESHVRQLIESLRKSTGREIRIPTHGESVQPGVVYFAAGGKHLTVVRRSNALILKHDEGWPEHKCRPAVDPMFRSVAEACGATALGIVLTGMGSDGALGAKAIRQSGGCVVVQDEATSVVWGMPGATVSLGAANAIAPLTKIADEVRKWTC